MIAALSLGMKLFFIMLTATGHATDVRGTSHAELEAMP